MQGEIMWDRTGHRKEFELYSKCSEMPMPELSFLRCVFSSKSHSYNWVEDGWQRGRTGSRDLEETGLKVCNHIAPFLFSFFVCDFCVLESKLEGRR